MSASETRASEDLLLRDARKLFRDAFGSEPTSGSVAGGRVNLIGEHTDYSQGFCMPIVIGLSTVCVIAKGKDPKLCRVVSRETPDRRVESFVRGGPPPTDKEVSWSTFLAGVAAQVSSAAHSYCNEKKKLTLSWNRDRDAVSGLDHL